MKKIFVFTILIYMFFSSSSYAVTPYNPIFVQMNRDRINRENSGNKNYQPNSYDSYDYNNYENAQPESFCSGFQEGYKMVKGNNAIVPPCPPASPTAPNTTAFRDGIKAGMTKAQSSGF